MESPTISEQRVNYLKEIKKLEIKGRMFNLHDRVKQGWESYIARRIKRRMDQELFIINIIICNASLVLLYQKHKKRM